MAIATNESAECFRQAVAEELPGRRARRDRPACRQVHRRLPRRNLPAQCRQTGVQLHGQANDLSHAGSAVRFARCVAAGAAACPRARASPIMMPNMLQYPVAMMGILRAGYTVVNINPLYTPRELEHQLKDSGAEAIIILENFAATLQAAIAQTAVKHVVVATMGDLLGLKGLIVNFVVRRVKKMVPAWSLPGHTPFNATLKRAAGSSLKPVDVGPDDIAFLQYTGGTTGVAKGAVLLHRNILANMEQMPLWLDVGLPDEGEAGRSDLRLRAAALSHLRADGERADGHAAGRAQRADPQPARHTGLRQGMAKQPIHFFPGLNTLFNALMNNEEFRKLDFSRAGADAWPAAWPCRRRWPTAGTKSPR